MLISGQSPRIINKVSSSISQVELKMSPAVLLRQSLRKRLGLKFFLNYDINYHCNALCNNL